MLNSVFARGLDPSEIYYELITRAWPMNALCTSEFDEVFTAAQVEQAWNKVADQIPIVCAHVDRVSAHEARMVFGGPNGTLPIAQYDDMAQAWAAEAQTVIDLNTGPLVRCSIVGGSRGTTVVLTAHHSAMDGRSIAELAMLFAEVLVNQTDIGDRPLAVPTTPLHGDAGTQTGGASRLTDAVATARVMRAEEDYVGAADDVPWHDPLLDAPRDIGFAFFELSEDETAGLVRWARSHRATVHGALSAAVLRSAAALPPGLGRVGLSTSVDLRSRFDSRETDSVAQAAGVISASYKSTGSSESTARMVSADIRRRFDRGEGELLFSLSGAGRFPVDHTADRVIRGWTEQATPTIFLGNVGVIDGPTPEALRRLMVGLAPIPNQVAYIAATTFRGKLSLSVGFDRNRLKTDSSEFASSVHAHVLELADEAERSDTPR